MGSHARRGRNAKLQWLSRQTLYSLGETFASSRASASGGATLVSVFVARSFDFLAQSSLLFTSLHVRVR